MGAKPATGSKINKNQIIMEQFEKEMKKDVKEYIRQSKKLDGNKSFKKTYVIDEDLSFKLELNGDKMTFFMLFKGITWEKTTIGDISNFDSAWDSFIHETHKHINKMLEGFRDSFNEKMDEFIEMNKLFKPFTVKNKEDHGLDAEIDLKTQSGFKLFAELFKYFRGVGLDVLCNNFIAPHLDAFNEGMSEYGTMILSNKDDKRDKIMFDPTSRLGRFIRHIAMDMKTNKE